MNSKENLELKKEDYNRILSVILHSRNELREMLGETKAPLFKRPITDEIEKLTSLYEKLQHLNSLTEK